jgi:hypothetical protein
MDAIEAPVVTTGKQAGRMHVFEITVPGSRLDYPDRRWCFDIEGMLYGLQSQFFDANVALNLFQERRGLPMDHGRRENWETEVARRAQLTEEVQRELGCALTYETATQIYEEASLRMKRERWRQGQVPDALDRPIVFIYARAFLFALDNFDRFLAVLAKQPNVPGSLAGLSASIGTTFPHLRGVRNSTHHLEDRARGLGSGGKPIALQPVSTPEIHAPGGALITNSLMGDRYSCTMDDGHLGEVEVTPESMETLRQLLQSVLDAFTWSGPRQHLPS